MGEADKDDDRHYITERGTEDCDAGCRWFVSRFKGTYVRFKSPNGPKPTPHFVIANKSVLYFHHISSGNRSIALINRRMHIALSVRRRWGNYFVLIIMDKGLPFFVCISRSISY